MRFKTLSLFLIFALSACTFQVEIIETPTPQSIEPSLIPFATSTIAVQLATPASTEEASILTSTPTPFPPPEPVLPSSGEIPIVFPINGTAQIMVGNIAQGYSQTYSVEAFKGQIMAISVLAEVPDAQGTFELEIKESDGTILCPTDNYQCSFWRGTLPATQKYFIKITPQVGGAFKLRVAINPPGQVNQYFAFDDSVGRYSLSFSDEFAPILYSGVSATKFVPEFALEYIDTRQYIPTNLSEAYFLVGSSTDPQAVAACTETASLGGLEETAGTVSINGVLFTKSQSVSLGAGNIYEQIFHRVSYNGTCYEITYFIHYTNIGNYPAGEVNEFGEPALLQKFDQTLSTLVLK